MASNRQRRRPGASGSRRSRPPPRPVPASTRTRSRVYGKLFACSRCRSHAIKLLRRARQNADAPACAPRCDRLRVRRAAGAQYDCAVACLARALAIGQRAAMHPSCSPMMSMSVFCPASKTLSLLVDGPSSRRAPPALKKPPKTAVSRLPAATSLRGGGDRCRRWRGGPDDALARLAARRARREEPAARCPSDTPGGKLVRRLRAVHAVWRRPIASLATRSFVVVDTTFPVQKKIARRSRSISPRSSLDDAPRHGDGPRSPC